MRSVSSANNLRKVHAKKEAERAEMEGQCTSHDIRCLGSTHTNSDSDDDDQTRTGTPTSTGPDGDASEEPPDAQATHRELMSRIFPQDADSVGRVAEQFFPRHEEVPVKTETAGQAMEEGGNESENRSDGGERRDERDQQMTETMVDQKEVHAEDVVMKEASEAQAVEQQTSGDALEAVHAQAGEDRDALMNVEQQASVAAQ